MKMELNWDANVRMNRNKYAHLTNANNGNVK